MSHWSQLNTNDTLTKTSSCLSTLAPFDFIWKTACSSSRSFSSSSSSSSSFRLLGPRGPDPSSALPLPRSGFCWHPQSLMQSFTCFRIPRTSPQMQNSLLSTHLHGRNNMGLEDIFTGFGVRNTFWKHSAEEVQLDLIKTLAKLTDHLHQLVNYFPGFLLLV